MVQLAQCFVLVLTIVCGNAQELLSFKNGRVEVNFGGYRAGAGLGGLLTGNAADGGLSASAGTPFGQHASAGLGGQLNGDLARGGLFALAGTPGQHAMAGLGGRLNGNVANGGLAASAGSYGHSASAGLGGGLDGITANGGLSASAGSLGHKTTSGLSGSVVGNDVQGGFYATDAAAPAVQVDVQKSVQISASAQPQPESSIQKIKHRRHEHHKKLFLQSSAEFQKELTATQHQPQLQHVGQSNVHASLDSGYAALAPATSVKHVDTNAAAAPTPTTFGGSGHSAFNAAFESSYAPPTFTKNANGNTLFDNIFAIPIATLQAVNQLVNNVATVPHQKSATISVKKEITAY